MYFLGILLSIGAPILLMLTESGISFLLTTYALSPEITVLIVIGYLYPLLLFAFSYFFRRDMISKKFYQSQVSLSSTLCVSLGLIGTFIGLSSMVASISSGMNADGDFNSKINTLLLSIGSSLDSMSLAFLTSILGVGASTVLSVSCNYLAFFYKDQEGNYKETVDRDLVEPYRPVNINNELAASQIAQAINKALDLKMFEMLGESIAESSLLQKQLVASLNAFENTQKSILTGGLDRMSHFSDQIVEQMNTNNKNLESLQGVFERFDTRFQECVEDFNAGLEKVSNFSYRIASEVDNNTSNLQSLQLLFERFDQKFQSYTFDFNEAMGALTSSSDRIVVEMDTVNNNLHSLHDSLNGFENTYQDNASSFNEFAQENTQNIKELSAVMFDLKFLLAPPLNETLETAIKNNALDIRYQPQVNVNSEVVGCEVLLQWKDPIRGLISNADIFGPEMEKYPELMIELDKWVIDNSIKQLAEWLRVGAWGEEWVLSINVVPQMAKDISLVSYLKGLVEKYSVNPANIAIEFKESIVLENLEAVKEIFHGIRDMGAKVYVDNYGKSHSSLVIYQRLKVDKLKIDRTVINDLIDEDGDTSVVRSIMASAKELELELMVEGVENDIQKMKLEELGFHHFQGYFVSHPISGIEYLS